MTTQRLTEIETETGVILPHQYTRHLCQHGSGDFAFSSIYSPDPELSWSLWNDYEYMPENRGRFLPIADNGGGDLILNHEQVDQLAVEGLGPEMLGVGDPDELNGDAETIGGLPNAPLEDGLHLELGDLLDPVGPQPVARHHLLDLRPAGEHEIAARPRQLEFGNRRVAPLEIDL
ncbi:MAG: SMI1/KNR4 family protein, partial [Acidimicrobiales bacterium]